MTNRSKFHLFEGKLHSCYTVDIKHSFDSVAVSCESFVQGLRTEKPLKAINRDFVSLQHGKHHELTTHRQREPLGG